MIKVTSYTNPESIVINSLRDLAATTTEDGWKVVLRFRDENEMKALQAALNYRFPENMKAIEECPQKTATTSPKPAHCSTVTGLAIGVCDAHPLRTGSLKLCLSRVFGVMDYPRCMSHGRLL